MQLDRIVQRWLGTGDDKKRQKAIARKAGIKEAQLSDIKTGKNPNPRWETVEKLAKGFGVTVPEFLAGPRPEDGAGLEDTRPSGAIGSSTGLADRLRQAIDGAKDSTWQSDVLEAIAALTRALGRESTPPETAQGPGTARRRSDRDR